MIWFVQEWRDRLGDRWVAACAAPLLVAVAWFTLSAMSRAASDVDSANAEGIRTLVVEAHDEWSGDPVRVPPAPRAARVTDTLAVRNRNPLNIKYGGATKKYVTQGIASISRFLPTDGGRFLTFESAAAGFRAAVDLLTSPVYASLDLDRAMKRWSNNGYGAEIVRKTAIDPTTSVKSLEQKRLEELIQAMAKAEGYRASGMSDEIVKAVADAAATGKIATAQR